MGRTTVVVVDFAAWLGASASVDVRMERRPAHGAPYTAERPVIIFVAPQARVWRAADGSWRLPS